MLVRIGWQIKWFAPFADTPPREGGRARICRKGKRRRRDKGSIKEKEGYTQRTEKENDAQTNFKVEQGAGWNGN